MVIVYPNDNSTRFLSSVVDGISSKLNIDIDYHYVNLEPIEFYLEKIQETDPSRTIIYMGHGGSDELNSNNGFDTAIPIQYARSTFKNKKIILLSCISTDFIANLKNNYQAAIGFGNIPTGPSELSPKDYKSYEEEAPKSILIFKEKLVNLFKNSIIEAYLLNHTFLDLYISLRLRINKEIANSSLSGDRTDRLVGELMFDLKKEMKLFGNYNTLVSE